MISLDSVQRDDSTNTMINRALNSAVYAYSARWLLLGNATNAQDPERRDKLLASKKELANNLWREARQYMYAAMARPTYRSVLALYLFGIIPSSPDKDVDGMEDACLEAALNHHNQLRSRTLTKTRNPDPISDLLDSGSVSVTDRPSTTNSQPEYKCMADIAYWFGIISDTTRSLSRCRPSILLPGRIGEKRVWAAVRQRTAEFEKEFRSLFDLRAPLSDSEVIRILQHAFAFKTLVWGAITHVQDAVFHQMSDITLADAIDAVRKESNRFEATFNPLLSCCQRDFMLLNHSTQLSYSRTPSDTMSLCGTDV